MTIDVSITMLGAVSRVTPQFGESLTTRTTIDNSRCVIYDYNIFLCFIVQAPDLVRLVKLVIIIDDVDASTMILAAVTRVIPQIWRITTRITIDNSRCIIYDYNIFYVYNSGH
jgi:hypothetical protein